LVTFDTEVNGLYPHASSLALNERYYFEESPYVMNVIPYIYRWYLHSVEVEIIGFYELAMEVSPERRQAITDPLHHTIYVPNHFVDSVLEEEYNIFSLFYASDEIAELGLPSRNIIHASFTLYDYRDYASFYDVVTLILGNLYDDYHAQIGTIEHLGIGGLSHSMGEIENVLHLFFQLTILSSFVVIGLIVTLFLRDRRFEMGIYMSLGAKKLQVVKQLLLETFYIIFPAHALSLLTGGILANRLNNFLMLQHLYIPEQSIGFVDNIMFYSNTINYEMVFAFHQISLNLLNILMISGVLFLTLLITMLLPAFSLLRLSPLILLGKNNE